MRSRTPTPLEQNVIAHAATGEELDCKGRAVDAEIIYALCVGLGDLPVHPRGIRLFRAGITGRLDLEGATLRTPLSLRNCFFENEIVLRTANAKTLRLSGSFVRHVMADGLETDGNVYLSLRCVIPGGVSLLGAKIGGLLQCGGAVFGDGTGQALAADRISVSGGIFMRHGFVAHGEVSLLGADVAGDLDCTGGRFYGKDAALSLDGIAVDGSVLLRARVLPDGGVERFMAFGEVGLPIAHVRGQVSCRGGLFAAAGSRALNASGLVAGAVLLCQGFEAHGLVELIGAELGSLECPGGSFSDGRDGVVIHADGLSLKGLLLLTCDFEARGEVRLLGARIGGQMSCRKGKLLNKGNTALRADGMTVGADLLLDEGFRAEGELSLVGIEVGGRLVCTRGTFSNPGEVAFDGEAMTVAGAFVWSELASAPVGKVDLSYASVGRLEDDVAGWPPRGDLLLVGFTYRSIGHEAPTNIAERLDWLRRSPFSPQPYEQLVAVYRDAGSEREARGIAIAKKEDARAWGRLPWPSRQWNRFLGTTIGHGYKPWLALRPLAVLVLAATLVFGWAAGRHIMVPKKPEKGVHITADSCTSAYPCFRAFPYSLDVALPILDLEQESAWRVDASKRWGWVVRAFMVITIAAGWALATTAIAGLTGLVRRI